MRYTETTPSYNERRYGRPWRAIVTTSMTKDFSFIDWDGRPGATGEFCFEAPVGTLLAYGQHGPVLSYVDLCHHQPRLTSSLYFQLAAVSVTLAPLVLSTAPENAAAPPPLVKPTCVVFCQTEAPYP